MLRTTLIKLKKACTSLRFTPRTVGAESHAKFQRSPAILIREKKTWSSVKDGEKITPITQEKVDPNLPKQEKTDTLTRPEINNEIDEKNILTITKIIPTNKNLGQQVDAQTDRELIDNFCKENEFPSTNENNIRHIDPEYDPSNYDVNTEKYFDCVDTRFIPQEALKPSSMNNLDEIKLDETAKRIRSLLGNEPERSDVHMPSMQMFASYDQSCRKILSEEANLKLDNPLLPDVSQRIHVEIPVINSFASYDKTRKPSNPETDTTFDELAKRCLGGPSNKIDERLIKEMEKLGVPQTSPREASSVIEENIIQMDVLRKPRKPVDKAELEVEAREFELAPLKYTTEDLVSEILKLNTELEQVEFKEKDLVNYTFEELVNEIVRLNYLKKELVSTKLDKKQVSDKLLRKEPTEKILENAVSDKKIITIDTNMQGANWYPPRQSSNTLETQKILQMVNKVTPTESQELSNQDASKETELKTAGEILETSREKEQRIVESVTTVKSEQVVSEKIEKPAYGDGVKELNPVMTFNTTKSADLFSNKAESGTSGKDNEGAFSASNETFVENLKSLRIRCNVIPNENTDDDIVRLLVQIDAIKGPDNHVEGTMVKNPDITFSEEITLRVNDKSKDIPKNFTRDKIVLTPFEDTKPTETKLLSDSLTGEETLSELLSNIRARREERSFQQAERQFYQGLETEPITAGWRQSANVPPCPPPAPICPPKPSPRCPPPTPPPCPRPCPIKNVPCPTEKKPPPCPTACPPCKKSCPPPGRPPCPKPKSTCKMIANIFPFFMSKHITSPGEKTKSDKATNELCMGSKDASQRLKKSGYCFYKIYQPRVVPVLKNLCYRNKNVCYARDYEPWVPIPSWPHPKRMDKRPFACPKEGCKIPLPEKNRPTCLPRPCTGFPKRKNSFSISNLFSSWLG